MRLQKKLITFLILIIATISCVEKPSTVPGYQMPQPLQPSEKLNVAFLIVDGVYNSELVAPMDIFQHTIFHTTPGMEVFTVAPDTTVITTFEGLKIVPDYSYLYDSLPTIDVLVVPSAENSMNGDLKNEGLIAFVKKTGENARFVMSLCDGAFVLAKAGLVEGKESTTFPSDIEQYKKTFPHLKVHDGVSFVHDGNLITSVGGAKSYDPALYLSELLYGRKAAIGLGKGLVIDWDINDYEFIVVD